MTTLPPGAGPPGAGPPERTSDHGPAVAGGGEARGAVPEPPAGQAPLTEADRRELEQLRREVAGLRAARKGRGRRVGRWVAAVALLVVGLLLGVSSVLAVFLRNQIFDTDRYVSTVAPLARDPVVQDAIANRLSNEILARVDLESLASQASAWLAQQGAPEQLDALVGPAVNGIESFVRTEVRKLVGTEQFAAAWDAANRVGHEALIAVVTGSTVGPVTSSGDTISVDLGVFLDTVKQRLVDAGFNLASRVPSVPVQFTVFQSPDLPKIRTAVRWLDRAATWLPWVALAIIVAAVFVAPDHRRGTILAGLFVGLGLLLLRLGFAVLRDYYLDRLPPAVQSPQAVGLVLVTVLRNVREVVTLLVVVALLAAVAAFLAGPSRFAMALRRVVNRGIDALALALSHSGIPFGPVPEFTARYRAAAAPVAIVLAAVILLFNPGLAAVLWLTVGVLVVLVVVETLARISPVPREPVRVTPAAPAAPA